MPSNFVLSDDATGTNLNEETVFQVEELRPEQQSDSTLTSQDMPIETLRHDQQNNSRSESAGNSAFFLISKNEIEGLFFIYVL